MRGIHFIICWKKFWISKQKSNYFLYFYFIFIRKRWVTIVQSRHNHWDMWQMEEVETHTSTQTTEGSQLTTRVQFSRSQVPWDKSITYQTGIDYHPPNRSHIIMFRMEEAETPTFWITMVGSFLQLGQEKQLSITSWGAISHPLQAWADHRLTGVSIIPLITLWKDRVL